MHEYSIASSLLRMAEQQAVKHAAKRVLALELRIGELAGVEVDLLETAWSLVRERSCCDGVDLAITRVPARWECRQCGGVIESGGLLACPDCGGRARLACGDELVLDRVEMERGEES
jgi:hydrogenase nickel incorporation protein HypA/HybF